MRISVATAIASITVVVGCTAKSTVVPTDSVMTQGVCDLPAAHTAHDGKRVQMRGRFDLHAHGVFLRDDRCPGFMLSRAGTDSGPDVSLCTPERLAKEFGCPGGNHNGPIVTVVGTLKPSRAPEYGEVLVSEMRDFENARTGERFTP